jgi:hypothetical protein
MNKLFIIIGITLPILLYGLLAKSSPDAFTGGTFIVMIVVFCAIVVLLLRSSDDYASNS